MTRTHHPVIRVPSIYFVHLQTHCRASAGPRPNITGMRQKYWGIEAPIIMCCNYAFLVSEEVYHGFECR